ncbi:MAG: DUF2480 family protein [Saprospiraceae bacterium]|nr:DUF2480 family protein [Saprospiraceae bacterium]
MRDKPLVNRVANSALITLNLENYYPEEAILEFDLKDYLFRGLILREKDFRAALKEHDWTQYQDKNLCIFCSTDAIIPTWAFQLVAIYATPFAKQIVQGDKNTFLTVHYHLALSGLDMTQYADKRIVIKGCSNHPVPASAYTELAKLLQPLAKSIMYGEPCSTVPLYKKPRKK